MEMLFLYIYAETLLPEHHLSYAHLAFSPEIPVDRSPSDVPVLSQLDAIYLGPIQAEGPKKCFRGGSSRIMREGVRNEFGSCADLSVDSLTLCVRLTTEVAAR